MKDKLSLKAKEISIIKSIFIILILMVLSGMLFSVLPEEGTVSGSFDVSLSAGDPAEDPTKDRIEALYGQIGAGGGGISLFTGKAAFSIDVEMLKLQYSGNVRKTIASPNYRVQAPWVGTGWSLTMGHISAVQNNTVELNDDIYYLVTEDGVSGELKQIGNTDEFYLEDYKYWLIERFKSGNKITHWQVTREDGTVYIYGDGVPGIGTKKGNHCTLAWDNWIGNGDSSAGTPDQVAYQWDLTEVKNVFNDSLLTIKYWQENETLGGWSPIYTKASYPDVITERSGRQIRFIRKDRDSTEWVDQHNYSSEPDAFMEQYETKRLDSIYVYSPTGNLVKKYDFEYLPDVAEAGHQDEGRGKQFLMALTEYDAHNVALPSYMFDYVDVQRDENNYEISNTHYYGGSIEKVTYPSGGYTFFRYDSTGTSGEIKTHNWNILEYEGLTGFYINSVTPNIFMNDKHFLAINCWGLTDGGLQAFKDESYLNAYYWDGHQWEEKYDGVYDNMFGEPISALYGHKSGEPLMSYWFESTCFPNCYDVSHYTYSPVLKGFDDKIALITPPASGMPGKLIAWNWISEQWNRQDPVDTINGVNSGSAGRQEPLLEITKTKMAVLEDPDYNSLVWKDGRLKTYHWDDSLWQSDGILKDTISFGYESYNPLLMMNENHLILMFQDTYQYWRLYAWKWDGNSWMATNLWNMQVFGWDFIGPQMLLTVDKLIISDINYGTSYLHVWKWTGESWEQRDPAFKGPFRYNVEGGWRSIIRTDGEKLILLDEKDGGWQATMYAWHWDGEQFIKDSVYAQTDKITSVPRNCPSIPIDVELYPIVSLLNNKIVVFEPEYLGCPPDSGCRFKYSLRAWHYDESDNSWYGDGPAHDSFIAEDFVWFPFSEAYPTMFTNTSNTNDVIVTMCQVEEVPWDYTQPKEPFKDLRAWRWDGMEWIQTLNLKNEIDLGYAPYMAASGDRFIISQGTRTSWNSFSSLLGGSYDYKDTLLACMDFNETWADLDGDDIQDYFIARKVTYDGMGDSSVTILDYANGVYDLNNGTAQYNKTTVTYPDTSIQENYFYNDLGQTSGALEWVDVIGDEDEAGEHYKKMDGKVYKTIEKNPDNSEYNRTTNHYELYVKTFTNGPQDTAYHSRINQIDKVKDGVSSMVTMEYNNGNGLVNKTTETNSDNSIRITKNTYAFEKYPAMNADGKHMLSQGAQDIVYETSVSAANARSSTVNTYKDWGGGNWAPDKVYVWRENDASTSLDNFTEWSTGTPDAEWVKFSEVSNRDSYGNILEYQDAQGTSTAVKWGHNNTLPVAGIQNALYTESFYDGFESGDFCGQEICWGYHVAEGGTSSREITTEDVHSGEYALKMIKNDDLWNEVYLQSPFITVTPGKEYTISVWYKCDPGRNAYINWYDYTHSTSHTETQEGTGEWELIEHSYVAPSGCTKMRVYLYGHSGSAETPIYYDDVRVYPSGSSGAVCQTQTYDPSLLKLSSRTDANNKPTYYEYDDFGRIKAKYNNDNKTLSAYDYSYSRNNSSNGQYDDENPNYISAYTSQEDGYYDKFSRQNLNPWIVAVPHSNINWSITNGHLRSQTVGSAGYSYINYQDIDVSGKNTVMEYDVYFEGSARWGGIWYRGIYCDINPSRNGWRDNSETFYTNYLITQNKWYHVRMIITPSNPYDLSTLYINGRQIFTNDSIETGSYSNNFIGLVSNYYDNYADYDNINISTEPVMVTSYYDGLGRGIQTRTANAYTNQYGPADLVQYTEYDFLNRANKVYKPYFDLWGNLLGQTTFSPPPQAVNECKWYYDGAPGPDCDDYPYSETVYRNSFSEEALELGFGGSDFRVGSGHTITNSYTTNGEGEFGYTANRLFEIRTYDENDNYVEAQTDKFGNKVGQRSYLSGSSEWVNTGFVYDILGNLEKVIPPLACTDVNNPNESSSYCTSYLYNTLSQVSEKQTPDAGTVNYLYDKKGNLRFARDANHASNSNNVNESSTTGSTVTGSFTMNEYGLLEWSLCRISGTSVTLQIEDNRGNEVFSVTTVCNQGSIVLPEGVYNYTVSVNGDYYRYSLSCTPRVYSYTKYDYLNRPIEIGEYQGSSSTFTQSNADNVDFPYSDRLVHLSNYYDNPASGRPRDQHNVMGRLSKVSYKDINTNQWGAVYYSYNDEGNVEWITQDLPGDGLDAKIIEYEYDLQGKVTQVHYNPGNSDAYYFWYDYDQLGRLGKVFSATSAYKPSSADAVYTYTPSGQIATQTLNESSPEVLDYAYTVRDWLANINAPSIFEPDEINKTYAMKLDYQYNGNISRAYYHTAYDTVSTTGPQGWEHRYDFSYDDINRLTQANFYFQDENPWVPPGEYGWQISSKYKLPALGYDLQGNIEYLTRNDQNGTGTAMNYHYISGTNKLEYVQGYNSQSAGNYVYDANGNLIKDVSSNISTHPIGYDYRNLPIRIQPNSGDIELSYQYDYDGNRVMKKYDDDGTITGKYYINDKDGRNLAVYDLDGELLFINIYGLDLIGRISFE